MIEDLLKFRGYIKLVKINKLNGMIVIKSPKLLSVSVRVIFLVSSPFLPFPREKAIDLIKFDAKLASMITNFVFLELKCVNTLELQSDNKNNNNGL